MFNYEIIVEFSDGMTFGKYFYANPKLGIKNATIIGFGVMDESIINCGLQELEVKSFKVGSLKNENY